MAGKKTGLISKTTFEFLSGLKKNNKKVWFDENRKSYEDARVHFLEFIDALIKEIARFEPAVGKLRAKECLFRINRDIRFSNDKTPYKTHLSAHINAGGKKCGHAGFFIKVGPGETGIAAGMHTMENRDLNKVRNVIAKDAKPLKKILASPSFQKIFGELYGEKLKSAPKGFAKDHPEIDLLKYKSYFAVQTFTDKDALSSNFLTNVAASFKIMKPFNDYLNQALQGK